MIFAAGLVLEREPLQWSELPAAFVSWVQITGIVAAIGLAIWVLAYLLTDPDFLAAFGLKASRGTAVEVGAARAAGAVLAGPIGVAVGGAIGRGPGDKPRTPYSRAFAWSAGIAGILFGIWLLLLLARAAGIVPEEPPTPRSEIGEAAPLFSGLTEIVFTLAAAAALFTVALPLLIGLFSRWSGRRIWAIAKLSLKEALHSRVVLIFSLMAIVFLFADWFVPFKPEDQLRNYVRAIYWTMPLIFLFTAGILGAFTIPTDLRKQSLHTIVTKPVERFEIVLGRFLGFGLLMTVGMVILSALSLLYVVRGVGEAAAEESYKARMPIYGDLSFWGTRGAAKFEATGENVGRIWDYRGYITGRNPQMPQASRQFAIWSFQELPRTSDRDAEEPVLLEFTFDIFRLSKGTKEKPGVPCTFLLVHGGLSIPQIEEREKAYKNREANLFAKGMTRAQIDEELIQEFGVFRKAGFDVVDYHTQPLEVPVSFFTKAAEIADKRPAAETDKSTLFKVVVEVEEDRFTQQTQMVGMAKRDLYLLPDEGPFWINFIKGIVGLWFLTLLVLGLALAVSTYLSGVIALLCTLFLFIAGANREFIQEIANYKVEGGGPIEASIRLARARPIMAPLDPGPGLELVQSVDSAFASVLGAFMYILPDVNRFDLQEYVASGFDIPWSQVLLLDNLIVLIGYLIPWAILAYYLMRFREVANPG